MFASDEVTVVLITEDPMLELAVRHLFGAGNGAFRLERTASFSAAEQDVDWSDVRVLLAEVSDSSDMERVAALKERFPGLPILCWCKPAQFDASVLRNSCDGVISRQASGSSVISALAAVSGRSGASKPKEAARELNIHLTYRESQLIALLARGYKNKEIGACLGITTGTVKVYLSNLFQKTGAKDRFELTLFGMKNSLYGVAERNGSIPAPAAAKRAISRPVLTCIRLLQHAPEYHGQTAGLARI